MLPILFLLSGLLIVSFVISVLRIRMERRMINEYTRMGESLTKLMTRELNACSFITDPVQELEEEDYQAVYNAYGIMRDSFQDVRNLYVIRLNESSGKMMISLGDFEGIPGSDSGDFPDQKFKDYLKKIDAGEENLALTRRLKKGVLLTYARPVHEQDDYKCYACVDFSMDVQHGQDLLFVWQMLGIACEIVLVISLMDIYIVRRRITGPINAIANCTSKFAYETEEDRYRNLQMMEELNIHTQDEIQKMYYTFMSVMKECLYYMSNLSRAQDNIQEQEEMLGQISKTAFRDALTGVGNQAAYNQVAEKLTQDIENKTAEFAIVMVDVNNLKFINDTYGHKMGDSYIRGCCSMICNIYKRPPVFRIGGDEFIVVLQNEDYACRLLRLTQMSEMFKGSYTQKDREDWERYSVSAGMAEYTADDKTVEQVQKRADAEMYANKMRFKKKFGSYR